jgi:cell division protein FtsW (lipid II flippase)
MRSQPDTHPAYSFHGESLLEGCFFAVALALALWVAQAIQQHGQEGVQRWQQDTQRVKGSPPSNQDMTLLTLWCQRDENFTSQLSESGTNSPCRLGASRLWLATLRWLGGTQVGTAQQQPSPVRRWQQEVMARSQQWRTRLLGADADVMHAAVAAESAAGSQVNQALVMPEATSIVQQESQLADNLRQLQARSKKRLADWDRWVAETVLPLVRAPAEEVLPEALLSLAQSLDGAGDDVGSRMVSQWLKAHEHAKRAGYLLHIMDQLPWLVLGHCLLTVCSTLWVRARIAPLQQLNGLLLMGMFFWGGAGALGTAPSPAAFPLLMIGLGVWMLITWVMFNFFKYKLPGPSPASSRLVVASWIPGWWLCTAIGWLLLLDESLHFHERLRFLALDQWWTWCLSALLLPLSAWGAPWALGALLRLNRLVWTHWPSRWWPLLAGLLCVASLGLAHRQHVPQHVTGELLKAVFVVVLCAWCIWKMPMTAQLWHAGHARHAWRGLSDVLWLMVLAAAAAWITVDKGPLLVLALLVTVLLSTVLGWTAGMGMLVLGFAAIFWLGVDLDVISERLQAWRDPFTANRDDMARLVWFQSEAARLAWGFGVGQVPWCGTSRLDVCRGVPLQLQSDYTFTALVGWWGPWGAWFCLLLYKAIVLRVLVYCARVSPKLLNPLALLQVVTIERAWALHLLFLFAVLMLMQAWITVAGNLGWLPLTGVTWPLLSYGKSSLWLSTLFVGAWGLRRPHA